MTDQIPETMQAVVYRGVDDLRVETVPVPRIQSGELLVEVAVFGICPATSRKFTTARLSRPIDQENNGASESWHNAAKSTDCLERKELSTRSSG